MSFFSSLFGNKKPYEVCNKVWMHHSNAIDNLLHGLKTSPKKIILVYFFEDTYELLRPAKENLSVLLIRADDILQRRNEAFLKSAINTSEIVFAEHFPALEKEEQVLNQLADLRGDKVTATFYISIEDPLIRYFSGERLQSMMEKMGMTEGECIENKMIDKSIENAQEKIQKKAAVFSNAKNAQEWFRKNLSAEL
jgi:hypothetical protein